MKAEFLFDLRNCRKLITLFTLISCMFFLSCAAMTSNPEKNSGKSMIAYDVVPSAQIEKVSYYFKPFKGKEKTLYFEVNVKNVSKEPKRFKLKVFIHEGPSAGSFYPRKPPSLGPGKSHMYPLPLAFFDKLPNGFFIQVEEASFD